LSVRQSSPRYVAGRQFCQYKSSHLGGHRQFQLQLLFVFSCSTMTSLATLPRL